MSEVRKRGGGDLRRRAIHLAGRYKMSGSCTSNRRQARRCSLRDIASSGYKTDKRWRGMAGPPSLRGEPWLKDETLQAEIARPRGPLGNGQSTFLFELS